MVKVAVIGAGYWGPNLIRNVATAGNAELACICDLEEARLRRIRKQYPSALVTTRFEAVLEGIAEAVILATPAATHYELGLRVLQSGKHLMVEKPMTMKSAEARALVDLAAAKDLVLMVGHTFEYNAAVRKVRELIQAEELGDVYYLYSQRVNLGKIRTNINAMWNLAPHDVSISNYLFGEHPIWVRANGFEFLGQGLEDVVFMTIGYPGSRIAHIHVSWLDPNKVRRTTVVGSRKMVVYDEMSNDAKVKVYDKGVNKVPVTDVEAPPFGEFQFLTRTGDIWIPRIEFGEPLHEEISHFIACVEGSEAPLTGGVNGLAVVRVLEAAQESLENKGTTIAI